MSDRSIVGLAAATVVVVGEGRFRTGRALDVQLVPSVNSLNLLITLEHL